jgi:hypothetical protein
VRIPVRWLSSASILCVAARMWPFLLCVLCLSMCLTDSSAMVAPDSMSRCSPAANPPSDDPYRRHFAFKPGALHRHPLLRSTIALAIIGPELGSVGRLSPRPLSTRRLASAQRTNRLFCSGLEVAESQNGFLMSLSSRFIASAACSEIRGQYTVSLWIAAFLSPPDVVLRWP